MKRVRSLLTKKPQFVPAIFIIFFVTIGLVTLLLVRASTPYVSLEAEDATKSGVQTGSDALASKGSYLQFTTAGLGTLPPGAALPSDQTCSARVQKTTENRPGNAVFNQTMGHQYNLPAPYKSRVDGNYSGTTDEILQWAACKWGIDPDVARAQAVKESYWYMTGKGDYGTTAANCPPNHQLGVDGQPGQCPESYGILQVRYPYHGPPAGLNTWPDAETSTAYNADYTYSVWRECYDGVYTWLGAGYAAGDMWGCIGVWYSGRWHTADAETYIQAVKDNLAQKTWQQPYF